MKVFCPLPRRFAVIQMDPVGMVKHFDDPIALAAARAMRPKKYLVYLQMPLELSTPTKPWFRYEVCPIGTTLRPEDKDQGITSDMVIPIYPNVSNARGRSPIRTETPFPFPNCYHWIRNRFVVRIRRKAVRYDDACAVRLGHIEHLTLDSGFLEDHRRIHAFHREELAAAAAATDTPVSAERGNSDSRSAAEQPQRDASTPESSIINHASDDVDCLPDGSGSLDDLDSDSSSISSRHSRHSLGSIAAIVRMDPFGFNVDDTVELVPLVDLWYELTDHLTAETIPSPVELYREWETIMQIIHDARERAPLNRKPFVDSGVALDYDALSVLRECGPDDFLHEAEASGGSHSAEEIIPPSSPRLSGKRLLRACQQALQKTTRSWRRPISWRVHPPCLPFWP
ncbi:hypothetical protein BV20DRAFT_1004902 [Pilatotrama ljubarskyi]|nr:hypothetical protein BV20DRAFT_1004902 [Pilatotrama ljubarskyi]